MLTKSKSRIGSREVPERITSLQQQRYIIMENKNTLYSTALAKAVFQQNRTLEYSKKNLYNIFEKENLAVDFPVEDKQNINLHPIIIYDAPKIQYIVPSQYLDWSPSNIVSLILGNEIFFRNDSNGLIQKMAVENTCYVSGVFNKKADQIFATSTVKGTIQVSDLNYQKAIVTKQMKRKVNGLSFCGNYLAIGGNDILILDLRCSSSCMQISLRQDEISKVKFQSEGSKNAQFEHFVCGGSMNGSIQVWDIRNSLQSYWQKNGLESSKFTIDRNRDKQQLVNFGQYCARQVGLINMNFQEDIEKIEVENSINDLVFSEKVDEIYTGHRYNQKQSIVVWDMKNKIQINKINYHSDDVLDIACSPDGKKLGSIGIDEKLIMWEI